MKGAPDHCNEWEKYCTHKFELKVGEGSRYTRIYKCTK